MKKVEVVNGENHWHPRIEWQVSRHLVGDMPDGNLAASQKGTREGPQQLLNHLFATDGRRKLSVASLGEVAVCSLRQEKHRLKRLFGHPQNLATEVLRKPPQPTVEMPQLFQIDDHLRQRCPRPGRRRCWKRLPRG